jgi:hypothetical protein
MKFLRCLSRGGRLVFSDMSDYLKSEVFEPLSEGDIDTAYKGYHQLQQVNRTPRWDDGQIQPLKEDALNFLKAFRREVSREIKKVKTLQQERDVALEKIEKFVNNQVSDYCNCKAFPHINAYRYAIDLALRVRRPRIIDQSETAFCGPVSIISAYFKTDPKAATDFALSLVENGWGNLRDYRIDPGQHVKNKEPPDRFEMTPVDWVLLTSLRHHFEALAALVGVFSKEGADPLRQLTKPGLLTAILTKMGYKDVVDRTFGYDTIPATAKFLDSLTRYPFHAGTGDLKGRGNLKRAELDLGRGMLIFLLAYGDLADYARSVEKSYKEIKKPKSELKSFPKVAKQLDRTCDEGFPELHWTLVRQLTVTSDCVLIRLYSYGKAREATFPMDQFLNVYQGYVMANPS